MKPSYSYEIDYEKIDPIGNELHYAGKVVYLYKTLGDQRKKLSPPFGEVWGRTKQEVKTKIDKAIRDWIDKQQ